MRRGLVLAAALAVVAGVAWGNAGRQRNAAPQVLRVAGAVSDLSADGARVAFHIRSGRCQRVRIWTPGHGVASIKPDCTHQATVQQLTLAGTRALWVDYDFGNHAYCALMTATLARPRPVELPECDPSDADRELHGLAGDGSLFAFNSWYDCSAPGATCPPGRVVYDVELWRVLNGKLTKIGASERTVTSVDSGRILLGPDPIVGLDSTGKELWNWLFHGHSLLAAKLQGRQVVASVPCGFSKRSCGFVAYKTPSGAPGPTRNVPRDASLRDFQDGIAAYLSRGSAHVLRMGDGRDRAFRAPGGRPILDAELERPGLFYSYNVRSGAWRGRIAFVSFAGLFR